MQDAGLIGDLAAHGCPAHTTPSGAPRLSRSKEKQAVGPGAVGWVWRNLVAALPKGRRRLRVHGSITLSALESKEQC